MRSAAALLLLALAACESPEVPPYRLWTLDDLITGASDGATFAGIPARMAVSHPGQPILALSPPLAAAEVIHEGDVPGLAVLPSFVDGAPAAYLVSEVWSGYDEVWVQPMYVLITAWDETAPFTNALEGAKPVFGIGPDSAFYSPYWEVFYALVPEGTPPDRYRSTKQILDDGLPLFRGPARFCALSRAPFGFAAPSGGKPVRPLSGEDLERSFGIGQGWVDGELFHVLDNGIDRFTWDAAGVIAEEPLFRLARRGRDGSPVPIGVPTVGGTGPLGSGKPADVRAGRPRFGSLWRLVDVLVPDGAAVVVPDSLPALRGVVEAAGLSAPQLHPDVAEQNVGGAYTGRVALRPGCLEDPALFPHDCGFLDSQAAIERLVSSNSIRRTDTLASCPLLQYGGSKVRYP